MDIGKMYINGEWILAKEQGTREIINPANGEVIKVVTEATEKDVEEAVMSARRAFDSGLWSQLKPEVRATFLLKIAEEIEKSKEELAQLETINNGKPLGEALSDVETAADAFRYYAGLTRTAFGETFDSSLDSMVVKQAVGVCALIVPWNFPLQMAAWKLAPCLAAGNVAVFKPAETTPLTAIKLFEIFEKVQLPKGVCNLVLGSGQAIGDLMTSHRGVNKISFTGGTETGKKVMTNALQTMKKVTLELGGKSPIVVFPDTDLEKTAEYIMFASFLGAGQICSAGSRLIVHESISAELTSILIKHTKKIVVGNGLDNSVQMGPIASIQHMNKVLGMVEKAREDGAILLTGGHRITKAPLDKGSFIEPTIFMVEDNDIEIVQEEVFGPVLVIQTFREEEEAVQLANSTKYGLAGAVFTKDFSRAIRMSKNICSGTVWINKYHSVNNQLPWGGFNQSGFGRDLGKDAFNEYLETKVIQMNLSNDALGFYDSFI
ncbi:aldehyde dehydrogenase family protein [Sporosarcina obsidiansis]|uniref:aldehyde dehydrogenase family protein n=1 Tax=Sporosarcina obsidiansis TaxID=2660748 RepID=UPI00129B1CF9|nr:aldehyde dehydrogenase family protein [Sporosarcina obsidiansis]